MPGKISAARVGSESSARVVALALDSDPDLSKSRKASFRAVFWLTVLVNCTVFIWLFTPSGGELLRAALASV